MIDSTSTTGRWRRRATCTLASTAMIATGFVALADTANAAPPTIYVNAAAQDGPNCGTSFSQCATIKAGVAKAQPGATVLVAAGTYNESVDITKGITVKSADGAATTIIDGDGLTLPNGVVNIAQPAGNVTFTGFTVKNQTASPNGDAFALTINDALAGDTITVNDNTFPAVDSPTDAAPYGVDSGDTAAKQVITGNDFSGLWRGILLEGSTGPVDVSDNDFHNLISVDAGEGDGTTYPPKGIYFLADKNVAATEQNVTNNKFRDYGGIGVSYRAGYDLGGCSAPAVCLGSISGAATGNTFALTDAPSTNVTTLNQQPAAFNVQSLFAGDEVKLALGGNMGTVPGRTIIEVPGPGTTTITQGDPNKIVPQPAPTVTFDAPSSILSDGVAKTFTASATNNSGETITNARYDVTITGTKGITASQVKLEYDADPTSGIDFEPIPLTGTASADGAITGFFGPAAGFAFPSSATPNVADFRLSFPDSSTPPDTLTTRVDLDQVSSGTGNPVINTLATDTSTTAVADAPAATVTVASAAFAGQVSTTDTTAVTATVKNVGGGVLANQPVVFTVDTGFVSATATPTSTTTKTVTAMTNASGEATAYVGSTVAGTQTITGESGDATEGTASKTYYANPASLTLTPESATFAAGTKQVFTATVLDAVGSPVQNTGVTFSIGDNDPGALNRSTVQTGADGKASVTLTTATDDLGSGTLTANTFILAGGGTKTAGYTVIAPVPPTSVASVIPTLGPIARVDGTQSVSIKVTNGDNTAPALNTEVDVLVSGASVANGTVLTNASGVATFTFKVQHMGDFTVKAVASGKSGTTSGTSPVRHVTIGLRLTTPSKGVITVVANTGPALANRRVAIYFVQGGKNVYYVTMYTGADGVATRNITGLKSNAVYTLTVQMYNDPDSDSLFSAQKSIRVR